MKDIENEEDMREVAAQKDVLRYARTWGRGTTESAVIYKRDHTTPTGKKAFAVVYPENYNLLRAAGFTIEPPLF